MPVGWRALGVVLWGILWFNFIQKGSQLCDVILHVGSGSAPKAHWWFEKCVSVHKIPEGTKNFTLCVAGDILEKKTMAFIFVCEGACDIICWQEGA